MDAPQPPAPPTLVQPVQPYPDPIPGVMPFGSITTFAGASGVGKTALYAGWIRRWLDGKTICEKPTNRPTQIGLLVGDRRWQSHRQWLDAAGVSDQVKQYSLRDDPNFSWDQLRYTPRVKDIFSRALDKLQLDPGSLLIVDPMPIWIPGKVNDYKDVAVGLGVLDNVIHPRDLTTFGIFHQSKQLNDKSQQYKRPQDRILGSAATIGFSDTAMYLLGPEDLDTDYYGFGWVPHNALSETFEFVRDAWGMFFPHKAVKDNTEREKILECVPYEPLAAAAIIVRVQGVYPDMNQRTVERRLKELLNQGHIVKVRHGIYQRIKPS